MLYSVHTIVYPNLGGANARRFDVAKKGGADNAINSCALPAGAPRQSLLLRFRIQSSKTQRTVRSSCGLDAD